MSQALTMTIIVLLGFSAIRNCRVPLVNDSAPRQRKQIQLLHSALSFFLLVAIARLGVLEIVKIKAGKPQVGQTVIGEFLLSQKPNWFPALIRYAPTNLVFEWETPFP